MLGKVCRVGMPASTSASKRRDFDVATITFNASRRCSHCFCLPFAVAAVALALAGVAVVVVLIVALFFTGCCSSERTARRRNSNNNNSNKICQLRNSPRTAQAHNTRTHTHTNTHSDVCICIYAFIYASVAVWLPLEMSACRLF